MKSFYKQHVKALSPLNEKLCRHQYSLSRCCHCQMLAFLNVNYSAENTLPFIVDDTARLIYKQLIILHEEDERKLLIEFFQQLWNDTFNQRQRCCFVVVRIL